jgi:hypothetical protein
MPIFQPPPDWLARNNFMDPLQFTTLDTETAGALKRATSTRNRVLANGFNPSGRVVSGPTLDQVSQIERCRPENR